MQMRGFEPLPPFADPRIALKAALPALRPAEQITVTEAAEKYMRVNVSGQWQEFSRDVTPYMVEPTDMIASRMYRGLAFCGPAQSGKTQMLQAAVAYTVASNPGRVALFQMTRDAAALFEREKITPMINNSPELRKRLAKGRGSDTIFQKLFTGGTHLTLDWPTITKLSSATIRLVLGTDYDRFPESVDGEGDAFTLMKARTRTYMSRGMVVVESSPGAPLKDEAWRAETPHEAPPVEYGILSLYPKGTRGRWYWPCPCCGALFEPTFAKLVYPDRADPAEAGDAAQMRCPHCRDTFGHGLKRELNGAGAWLHESSEVDANGRPRLVGIDSGLVRRTDTLSYWLDGAAAAFSTWAELVEAYENAKRAFESTGDEEQLKSTINTGQAQPYMPRSASDEMTLTVQGLRDKAQGNDLPRGVAPAWARYITISVDVQSSRFPVGVTAWGENGRHMPIDRFDLFLPPGVDGDAPARPLKPFEVAADWDVLATLAERAWPIDGGQGSLRAISIGIDMHGGGATTENAYRFFRARRKAGEGSLWYLTRGEGGLKKVDRVWLKAPERSNNVKRKAAVDIKILHMATDRLKDAVAASLRVQDGGTNDCEVPRWMTEDELGEVVAERRGTSGWEKRPGVVRNESFDHLVQARAQHLIKGGERVDWTAPPEWAVLGNQNRFFVAAVQPPQTALAQEGDVSLAKRKPRPQLPAKPKGQSGFMLNQKGRRR
ncbi:phage terminase large subunit family protein [Ketogulonicigenium vulgare]|uniref:phage terminase large subunit family protein n=1 Tax=Ketogulonicigenium vulgare TaxID=92945 RepID=UPI002359DA49|nr:terminase gpA endonuclease subunit [Ketogulonicigenium vulgare]